MNPFKDQKGQGLVEYGIILVLVAIVVMAVISCFWLLLIPVFVMSILPWLTATFSAAQEGSQLAQLQLIMSGALLLCCLCCCCGGGARVRISSR